MNGRVLFRLWLGLFLCFALFAHGNLESTDSAFTMHAARALLVRGDAGLRPTGRGPEWVAEKLIADHIATAKQYGMLGSNGLAYVWFPIGHEWVMLPALALGEFLQRQLPQVERDYRQRVAPGVQAAALEQTLYPYGQFVFDQALVALLPALFGAGSVILLLLLAQSLGATTRQALLSAGAVALCSQFFPLTRENLSDGPGMFFLLAGLLGVVRYHKGTLRARGLVLTGLYCGCAVLARYPHALLVAAMGAFLAVVALRQRRPRDLAWFVLGGLPCLLLLCTVNWARFGEIGETGYGNQALAQWFNYPPWLGLPKILIGAGKGILWFSPLLWLCVPGLAALRGQLRWLALVLFVLPLVMFSSTNGWQSGQCWGIRYVTPGVVALLALVLPVQQPWRRWPRTFAVLCALGVLVNVTSLLAPTRGQNQLAGQAVEAVYRQEFEQGRISTVDLKNLDHADHYFFLWQFSPLHSHWTYAWLALRGELEDEQGNPRGGAQHNVLPLFGVDPQGLLPMPERKLLAVPQQMAAGPQHWEDRGFRHLWWRFWADLLGISSLWFLVPAVLLAGIGLWPPLWRLLAAP